MNLDVSSEDDLENLDLEDAEGNEVAFSFFMDGSCDTVFQCQALAGTNAGKTSFELNLTALGLGFQTVTLRQAITFVNNLLGATTTIGVS